MSVVLDSLKSVNATLLAIEVDSVASVSTKRSLQALAREIIAQCGRLETLSAPELQTITILRDSISLCFETLKAHNVFWGFWGTGATVTSLENALTQVGEKLASIKRPTIAVESLMPRPNAIAALKGYVDNPHMIGSGFSPGEAESFTLARGAAADTAHLDAADTAQLLEFLT